MRILVLACGALLALAAGFEVYSSEYPPTALIEFLQSQPLMQKLAWAVIIVTPFGLLAGALWESARLEQQRKANEVWETRFRGVRKAGASTNRVPLPPRSGPRLSPMIGLFAILVGGLMAAVTAHRTPPSYTPPRIEPMVSPPFDPIVIPPEIPEFPQKIDGLEDMQRRLRELEELRKLFLRVSKR